MIEMNHQFSQNSFDFSITPSKEKDRTGGETSDLERISEVSAEPISFFPSFPHSKTPKSQVKFSTVDKGSPSKLRKGAKEL
jgi:hypothetical protein